MTGYAFKHLAELARQKPASKSTQAARLVLCAGLRRKEAANQIGITESALGEAIRRIENAKRLALNSL